MSKKNFKILRFLVLRPALARHPLGLYLLVLLHHVQPPIVESGATMLNGAIPINTSGGLVSKGHPVGATGLSMIYELITQSRGEAGPRQVKNARLALQENGGGVIGFEEAACSIIILEKDR